MINFVDKPEEIVSLNGYIITKLGYVPKTGEKIYIGNLEIEILDSNYKMVRKLKITKCTI